MRIRVAVTLAGGRQRTSLHKRDISNIRSSRRFDGPKDGIFATARFVFAISSEVDKTPPSISNNLIYSYSSQISVSLTRQVRRSTHPHIWGRTTFPQQDIVVLHHDQTQLRFRLQPPFLISRFYILDELR
jgi:hypothetical protein